MSTLPDPHSLLEQLRLKYGVDESDPLHGPSVIVPNRDYKPEWTGLLSQAGFKVYCGEQAGRVAWAIPLKGRFNNPGGAQDSRSNETASSAAILRPSQDQTPRRGCITGRLWTQDEDKQILEMLGQGKTAAEISHELAARLDRTDRAVRDRVRRLRKQRGPASQAASTSGEPKRVTPATEGPPAPEPEGKDLRRLLESALLLADEPKHKPALRLILEACLRLAASPPEK